MAVAVKNIFNIIKLLNTIWSRIVFGSNTEKDKEIVFRSFIQTRIVSKGHGCPRLKNLKRKLLTSDADGDGRTERCNTICPFYHSSNGGGIKVCRNKKYLITVIL